MVIATTLDGRYTHNDAKVPLINVSVVGDMIDCFGSVTVTQTYENRYTRPIEAKYMFTLADGSIISAFKMTVGSRLMVGVIKNKSTAYADYSTAKDYGRRTALLVKNKDLYSISIGNILPNEQITITFTYLTELPFDSNGFKYVLPTNIAPLYIPAIDKTKYADRIVTGLNYTTSVCYDFNVHITWYTGTKFLEIVSPTNHISYIKNTDKDVSFTVNTAPSHGDFVVYAKTDGHTVLYDYCDTTHDNDHYLLLSHKIADIDADVTPKSYQFIIDQSGSMMSNNKIDQALEALELFVMSLTNGSIFNVIGFGDHYNALWKHSVPVTNDNVKIFKQNLYTFRKNMNGTEIYDCLNDTLRDNLSTYRIESESMEIEKTLEKVFILLTDGQVTNIADIITMLNDHKLHHNFRIFGIGLGHDASRPLIETMSNETNGTFKMVADGSNLSDNVIQLLNCASKPYLINPTLEIGTHKISQRIIYFNQYFSTCCKLDNDQYLSIMNKDAYLSYFKIGSTVPNREPIPVTSALSASSILKYLWAQRTMRDAYSKLHGGGSDIIVKLSLEYQLMSDLTSFVVVDDEFVTSDECMPFIVPQYSPAYYGMPTCAPVPASAPAPAAAPTAEALVAAFASAPAAEALVAAFTSAPATAPPLDLHDFDPFDLHVFDPFGGNSTACKPYDYDSDCDCRPPYPVTAVPLSDTIKIEGFVFNPTTILKYKDVNGSFKFPRSGERLLGYIVNTSFHDAAKKLGLANDVYFNLEIYNEFKKLYDSKYVIILNNLKKWLELQSVNADEMIKLL